MSRGRKQKSIMSCLFNGIRTSSSGLLNLECDWVEFPSSVSATKKATLQEMPLKNINNYIAESFVYVLFCFFSDLIIQSSSLHLFVFLSSLGIRLSLWPRIDEPRMVLILLLNLHQSWTNTLQINTETTSIVQLRCKTCIGKSRTE